MRIYVSGPMSNMPKHNIPAFNRAAKALRRIGYDVVNPAELDAEEQCVTWEQCLRRDLRFLVLCDAIATLPGWKKSKGAQLEVHVGKELSFMIMPLDKWLRSV